MRTRWIALLLVVALLAATGAALAQTMRTPSAGLPAQARVLQGERIMLNGKQVTTEAPPLMHGTTMMVPAQPIFRALNVTPTWSTANRTLTARVRGQQIMLKEGDRNARLGRGAHQLSVAPFRYRNQLYVPLNFMGQALQARTSHDTRNKRVIINTQSQAAGQPANVHPLAGTSILVNGRRLATSAPPVTQANAVMVPAQPVLRELNAKPSWNAGARRLTATHNGQSMTFTAGSRNAMVGSRRVQLSQAPFVYRNELYLPVTEVGRLFGTRVAYQARARQIVINSLTGRTTAQQPTRPSG